METSTSKTTDVAIIKGETPVECILNGLKELGGISKYINEGDQVFIKINLSLPNGFPSNTNLDVVKTIIQSFKEAGAKKIYVGSFPFKGITLKAISDCLGLQKYFVSLGAELVYLDNSKYFIQKRSGTEELKAIKEASFSPIELGPNEKVIIPKVVLNSDKYIIINQVNVDPLFKCRLSLLSSYSIIPNRYQEIVKPTSERENYMDSDQYKSNLLSNISDVFRIKKPDLIINDLFYVLEGAGPYIYKDSHLKKTGLIILGTDVLAVDTTTLKTLNLEYINHELYASAREKGLGVLELTQINNIGEKIEDVNIDINLCVSKLEEISVKNMIINSGKYCSGCFKNAYHLLNLMKTNMVKDLKYCSKSTFLIGENPPEPELLGNIIIFGDCTINSTQNYKFKKIKIEKKKKIKEKQNKSILELSGCPPDIFKCVEHLLKFYGKADAPMLNFFYKSYCHRKIKKKLDLWEEL